MLRLSHALPHHQQLPRDTLRNDQRTRQPANQGVQNRYINHHRSASTSSTTHSLPTYHSPLSTHNSYTSTMNPDTVQLALASLSIEQLMALAEAKGFNIDPQSAPQDSVSIVPQSCILVAHNSARRWRPVARTTR